MAEQKLLQDADLNNPIALMTLNMHILDYMKIKGLKSSSNAFEEELKSKSTNDHQRTVKVISGLLMSKWNSCYDADLCLPSSTDECLKDRSSDNSSARLDGYIHSYLASHKFKDTAEAFYQEAKLIKGLNPQDELFTKFWLPKVFSIFKEGQTTCGEKRDRPKFSVSLSPREIAEDFLAMTGQSLPSSPKRRPQSVQRLLDTLFPGSGLKDISPHGYKTPCETVKPDPEAHMGSTITRVSKVPLESADHVLNNKKQQESTQKTEDIQPGPSAKPKIVSRNQPGSSINPKRDSRKRSNEDSQTGPSTRPNSE